jgi:acyl-CoA synthetase (AMP-forming)/AMP-acid ligase II
MSYRADTCLRIDALALVWAADAGARARPVALSTVGSILWADLETRVQYLAQSLVRLGVQPGDRIAFLGAPTIDFLVAWLAIMHADAVYVGLNPRYTTAELSHAVELTKPRLVVAQLRFDGRPLAPLPAGSSLPVLWFDEQDLSNGRVLAFPELATPSTEPPPPPDVCSIVFTSGTTGRPKAAMLTHRGLLLAARVQHDRVGPNEPGQARYLCNLPVNHVGCLMNQALAALVAGGSIVFQPRFDAGEALALMARHGVTVWMAVPAVVHLCLTHSEAARTDFSSLRSVLVGGGAMSLPTVAALRRLTRARVWAEYGQTETSSTATYTPDEADDEALTGTIGAFEPRFEYRIARPDGSVCAVGESGEIQGRGPLITPGYYRDEAATAAAFTADGWLKTGDLAEQRPDGLVVLRGRAQEMIKSGGYNLYPREIEMRLETHPAIDLVVVVGLPDEVFGEAAHAVFSCKPAHAATQTTTHNELKAWCAQTLANYKVPKSFRSVAAMPLLSNGKLDRSGVRRLAPTLTPLNGDKQR